MDSDIRDIFLFGKLDDIVLLQRFGEVGSKWWHYGVYLGLIQRGISAKKIDNSLMINYARRYNRESEFLPFGMFQEADRRMREAVNVLAKDLSCQFNVPIVDLRDEKNSHIDYSLINVFEDDEDYFRLLNS